MKRFIATVLCGRCGRVRVRVYDWLPECVLCARCQALEHEGTRE